MLGKKKSIYKRPVVILASVILLILLNVAVVNNPAFATRIADLGDPQTEMVAEFDADQNVVVNTDQNTAVSTQPAATQLSSAPQDPTMQAQLKDGLRKFWILTGFRNCKIGNIIMILVGILFIFLAVRFEFEPMLLIPIGTGIICGNIPFFQGYGVDLAKALEYAQAAISSGSFGFDYATAERILKDVFAGSNGNISISSINNGLISQNRVICHITIPYGVTSIGSHAFQNNTSIIEYDFSNCTSIPTLSNTNAFLSINALCKIKVPASLESAWKTETNWSTYANYIVGV